MVRSAVALALLLASTSVSAISPDFKARADKILANAYPADGPGAAVIVTEGGRTIYSAGRGLADVQGKKPITPATVFRLGSITKQFTAAAILRLAEQAKLSLDDPLSKFVPAYPAPGASATVRQLLNHTSGVMPYTAIPGWMVEANTGKVYTTEQLIAVFKDLPPPSKPGEKWDYNNSGYVLLGAILEKVTGKPWDQAVGDLVTRPLHLSAIRSGIGEDGIRAMANGYTDHDGKVALSQKIHMSVPHGAGALVGTVGDLATWADALHNGRVLSPASYAAMSGSTTTTDGKTEPYGFGLRGGDVRGHKAIGHGGGIFGFSTDSFYLPKEKIFVAVFANSDSPQSQPETVARRLAAAALGDPYPEFTKTTADLKALASSLGVYTFADTERTLFERDGKLYTQRQGGPELEIFAAGDNRFFYGPESFTWLELTRDTAGKPQIAFHQEGAPKGDIGTYKGPPPAAQPAIAVPAATLDSYVGAYASEAGTFVIARRGEELTVKLEQQQALPLRPISATEFEITRVGAKIRFNVDAGKAGSLTLFQNGRELKATRKD
jgi:CubicO group peptidase (beta-lactamase class C family)